MLTERPKQCPICNGEWIISKAAGIADLSCTDFMCANWKNCQLLLKIASSSFYIIKTFNNGGGVWWCSNGPCEMRLARDGFKKLTFDPPFDIDEKRLRLLLVFS